MGISYKTFQISSVNIRTNAENSLKLAKYPKA